MNQISLLIVLLFHLIATNSYSQQCESFYKKLSHSEAEVKINSRLELIKLPHDFSVNQLLRTLSSEGKLLYEGKHKYVAGTDFLASNEFDWSKTPMDHKPTDILIAFGTNSAWDIALDKNAKSLVISDWSPWPLIAQNYLISPLLKTSKSRSEFILALSGVPKSFSEHLDLDEAFSLAKKLLNRPTADKKILMDKLLVELANDLTITDLELKFITTYLMAKVGETSSPYNFGPFQNLRNSVFADFNLFYETRYNPKRIGPQNSVFSSEKNFAYLKNLFLQNRVSYGLTAVNDPSFYAALAAKTKSLNYSKVTVSVSNIFSCGGYNGLTFIDFQNYLQLLMKSFQGPITVFRTTSTTPPHNFFRYDLKKVTDIPEKDEEQITSVTEPQKAG